MLTASALCRTDLQTGAVLLRDVSLTVVGGERLAVTGPSGAGKTLLLRLLALLDAPTGGQVLWRGGPVAAGAVPAFRRQVVYLHQRPALLDGTVAENLQAPFAFRSGANQRFDEPYAAALLARLGRPEGFLAKSARDLSGGESQLVSLVRALQLRPSLLLLDEPTAALDDRTANAVAVLLRSWLDERAGERAYVWVSHDERELASVTDRRVSLAAGSLAPPRKGS